MKLTKAIDKETIDELRKVLEITHSPQELKAAINYAKNKKKFAFIDTSTTLSNKEYDERIQLLESHLNAFELVPKINKDVLSHVKSFVGGKKTRKSRKSKSKKNQTKKSKRINKRKSRH